MTIILFTTAGCHLCEQAKDILNRLDIEIIYNEIGDDDSLVERYGIKIPVLKFTDDSEMNWPFNHQEIQGKLIQLSMLT